MKPNYFHKGLHTDNHPKHQPEGTYRYGLSGIKETLEGEKDAVSSDRGTLLCLTLPMDVDLVGHTLTNTEDIIGFLALPTTSQIINFNPNTCTYQVLIDDPGLNFSISNPPVNAIFRIRKGCERTIYFTDRTNPYRSINLDSLEQYKDDAGNWITSRFNLSPTYSIPQITATDVHDSGGFLKVGSYQFAIRYLDEDLNPSNWFYITHPIWIYDEFSTAPYNTIDGAIPTFDNADPEDDAVPETNKSIKVEINNLDGNFPYIQLAVIHNTSGTGVPSEIWLLSEQYITSSTFEYIYPGANENQDTQITLSELTIDPTIIDVAETHVVADNSLLLGNLKDRKYDFATFQQAANNIIASWITTPVAILNATTLGNSKNQLTPHQMMSLMGGEVYALSVQYLFPNSYWTPACHIPGREKTAFDSFLFPVNTPNTRHLPLPLAQVERWQIEDTALSDGTLAYYEAPTPYPDTTNCDGERIYPSGNIRHHKMPSRRLLPAHNDVSIFPIGLEFDNITYPHPDIIGHRFLISIRNNANSTVTDTAVIPNLKSETNNDQLFWEFDGLGVEASSVGEPDTDTLLLLSPKSLVNKELQGVDYITLNYSLQESLRTATSETYDNIDIDTTIVNFQTNTIPLPFDEYNRSANGNLFVGTSSDQQPIQGFSRPIRNNSLTNTFNFLSLEDTITTGYKYVTLKKYIFPYESLSSIIYRPLHHNYLTLSDSQEVYGGDTVISELRVTDIPFYKSSGKRVQADLLDRVWVESTINYSLVHGGTTDATSRYKTGNPGDHFIKQVAEFSDGDYTVRDSFLPEFYGYNKDYSKINVDKGYFPLPLTFNYCSDCTNEYPGRIRFSLPSYQEETSDNYKIFLANNYTDLPGTSGELLNLYNDKDEIYANTIRDQYFISTRPQQLQSNETTVFIGTGEKLSIPPKKLATSDYGYLGTIDYNTFTRSEYGTFFTNSRTGKIFLLDSKLNELSMMGMSAFFEENLPLQLLQQFKSLGLEYPYLNRPYHSNGIGIISTYDPRHSRIILHKRDYKAVYPLKVEQTSLVPNTIYYNTSSNTFKVIEKGNIKTITLDNTKYFENKSFTISYSLKDKCWEFFYPYFPKYLFHTVDTFYSTDSSSIYSHNYGPYQTYYGVKYPFIIDSVVSSPLSPQVFSSLFVSCNTTSNLEEDKFFTSGFLYNSDQCSGLRDISRKTTAFDYLTNELDNSTLYAEKVDKIWRVSNFRNYVPSNSTLPIFTSDWNDIQDSFPIDKIPNPGAINLNRSQFEADRFRDEYLGFRFYFQPDNDIKMNLHYILAKQRQSIR